MHKKYFYIRLLGFLFSAGALAMEDDACVNWYDSDPLPIGYGFGPHNAYSVIFGHGLQQSSLSGEEKNSQLLAQTSVEVSSLPKDGKGGVLSSIETVSRIALQQPSKRLSSSSLPVAKKAKKSARVLISQREDQSDSSDFGHNKKNVLEARPRKDTALVKKSASRGPVLGVKKAVENASGEDLVSCMHHLCRYTINKNKNYSFSNFLTHLSSKKHNKDDFMLASSYQPEWNREKNKWFIQCLKCNKKIKSEKKSGLTGLLVQHWHGKSHDFDRYKKAEKHFFGASNSSLASDEIEPDSDSFVIKCMSFDCSHFCKVTDKNNILKSLRSHMFGSDHNCDEYNKYSVKNLFFHDDDTNSFLMDCPKGCNVKISGKSLGKLRKNLVYHLRTKMHDPERYALMKAYVYKSFPALFKLEDKKYQGKDLQQIVHDYNNYSVLRKMESV